MFGDLEKLNEMMRRYDTVSPTFCMAKWMHVTIHLLSGHTHSCYLPGTHKIPLEEIKKDPSALHNTSYKKQMRKLMLEGKRPDECRICWQVEDLPGDKLSDRKMRAVDSWTMPYFDKVRNMKWDENINPSYVEVSFSYNCNFKCSYCSPHISSKWMEEIRKHGPYELSEGGHQDVIWLKKADMMPIEDDKNPYIEAFWKWWPDLVKDLMFFRMTGGEPLLSKDTFKVLDWIHENPLPNLNLSVNSNMCVPDKLIDRFIGTMGKILEGRKVHSFMLHTSCDTFGDQAAYLRNGMDFAVFQKNVERYLTELPEASLAFMCTFNNLSIVGFRPFLDWYLDLRARHNNDKRSVLLDIPHLMGPRHQSAQILTEDFQERMIELIEYMKTKLDDHKGFRRAEVEKMERILGWMRMPLPEKSLRAARKDFYLFFSEHDKRRKTSLVKTFPEMKKFWNLCKKLNEADRAETR